MQDRNVHHGNGSSEASRLTAQARKRLASLGTTVEALADRIESSTSVCAPKIPSDLDLQLSLLRCELHRHARLQCLVAAAVLSPGWSLLMHDHVPASEQRTFLRAAMLPSRSSERAPPDKLPVGVGGGGKRGGGGGAV